MIDREKVIDGLEHCSDRTQKRCNPTCPYNDRVFCETELAQDALALLKEQEAVEPKQVDLYGNDEWWGLVCVCPDCKAEWMSDKADTHFCPKCGRAVKWE